MVKVTEFSIHYHQYLNEQGEASQEFPEFAKDNSSLLQLYRTMSLIRTFDKRAIALQRTGQLGTYASPLGQEAIAVGLGHAMAPEDVLCPAYREYGAMIQRGIKLSEILLYWGGSELGNAYENNKEDMPICVPIATQCLHAAGIAKAFQLRKEPRVAVSVSGDGSTSEGDFYEAINLAGAWKLPAVFIINNNQWAISVPRKIQTGTETIAQKGIAAGMPVEQVDGNDIIAVRESCAKALERARNGGGPSLIEAITYRLCDHTTADDASRYVDKSDLEMAWQKEPLIRLNKYLTNQGVWDENKEEHMQAEITELVQQNVETYLKTPKQAPEAMFDYLYESLPDALAEQYASLIDFEGTP